MITEVTQKISTGGVYNKETQEMTCPVCNKPVDFLLGEDTPDGGKMGCEGCFKPAPSMQRNPNPPEPGDMLKEFDKAVSQEQ